MRQVKRVIAPASGGSHPPLRTGSPKQRRCPQPRIVDNPPGGFVPRIKRLPLASDMPLRGPASATLVGESGANLVLSRLQGWGIPAQPAMAGLPYDLLADVPGFDLVRIQVKTTSQPGGGQCSFRMQRGYHRSKSGVFAYTPQDFDIAAFVCLSLSAVFFYAGPVGRISVRTGWLRVPGIDVETLSLAIRTLRRERRNDALAWLASMSPDALTPIPDAPGAAPSGEQAEFDFGGGC